MIKVYNTAINAWAALPPHDYKPLIAKYGDRFQMQDLDEVKPVPSGLLGTIRLFSEAKHDEPLALSLLLCSFFDHMCRACSRKKLPG